MKVDKHNLLELLLKKFPELRPDWEVYSRKNNIQEIFLIADITFMDDFIIENFLKANKEKLTELFHYIEFLLVNGDQYVKDVITTGLIESLANQAIANPKLNLGSYLGKQSRIYYEKWIN